MQQSDDEDGQKGNPPLVQTIKTNIKELVSDVLILHTDVKRENYLSEEEYIAEIDVVERANDIAQLLNKMDIKTRVEPWSNRIPMLLYQSRPDVVINLVETFNGSTPAASLIPALLQLMDIPYTGSSNQALRQASNKAQVKDLFFEYDLPTPQYELVTDITDKIPKSSVEFPLIVKPSINMGGSVGIDDTSVCTTWRQVYDKVTKLLDQFDMPILVEEFIEGRELTAVLVQEDKELKVYFGEKVFKSKPEKRQFDFLSWNSVWEEEDSFDYAPYTDKSGYLTGICKEAFDILDLTCYVKIDIRLNKQNRPYFIDVNPDCSMGPAGNAISNVPALYGVTFENSLYHIIKSALNRQNKL